MRLLRWLGVVALAALLGCEKPASGPVTPGAPAEPGSTQAGTSLLPVPVPDLSRREEGVRTRLEAMRQDLDRAVEEGLEPALLAQTFSDAGMLYHANTLHQAAAACYRNAILLSGSTDRLQYLLGQALRVEGDAAGAIAAFRESVGSNPDYLASHVVLAELLLDENRVDEAQTLLERARSMAPESARVHIGLARVAVARESYGAAVEHYETALRLAPQATVVHYPLGLAYRELGEMEKARAYLEQRGNAGAPLDDPWIADVILQGSGAQWHAKRGTAAYQAGRLDEAVKEFRAALELDPGNVDARMNLAVTMVRLGDDSGALEQYLESVRQEPGNARAHFGVGTLQARLGRDEKATRSYARAVQLDEGMLDAHFNLANALSRLGREEDSLPHYRRVVELDPRNANARYALAQTLVRLERWSEAVSELESGYEALPDFLPLKMALARVLATAPEDTVRNGERALTLAQELYQVESSVFHLETLAMAQAETRRLYDARDSQRRALAAVVNAGRQDLVQRMEANLELYLAGQPSRDPNLD